MKTFAKIILFTIILKSIITEEQINPLINDDIDISLQFMEAYVGQTFEISIAGENTSSKKWYWGNSELQKNKIIELITETYDGIAFIYKFVSFNTGNIELEFYFKSGDKTEILHLVEVNVVYDTEINKLILQMD